MPLPHVVARVNRRVTNRLIEPVVSRSPRFIRVHHIGRRSGRAYSTPLYGFVDGDAVVVVLTYGLAADWLRNVQAGPASIEREGVVTPIETIEITGRDAAWHALPRFVRLGLTLLRVTDFARLTPMHAPPARS